MVKVGFVTPRSHRYAACENCCSLYKQTHGNQRYCCVCADYKRTNKRKKVKAMESFVETGEAENVIVVTSHNEWLRLATSSRCRNCNEGQLLWSRNDLLCKSCKMLYINPIRKNLKERR